MREQPTGGPLYERGRAVRACYEAMEDAWAHLSAGLEGTTVKDARRAKRALQSFAEWQSLPWHKRLFWWLVSW